MSAAGYGLGIVDEGRRSSFGTIRDTSADIVWTDDYASLIQVLRYRGSGEVMSSASKKAAISGANAVNATRIFVGSLASRRTTLP